MSRSIFNFLFIDGNQVCNSQMKAETVLKSINEALSCIESARYFAPHDMPESVQAKCGEAIGHLKATKLYLESEIESRKEVPHEGS
jgi:hypothetical protein